MAWTEAARIKAAKTRRETGITNGYDKAKSIGKTVTMSDATKSKIGAAAKGRRHSDATKKLLSEKARASTHRRVLRSTRKYLQRNGQEVLLDSSWEEALAIRLDQLGIDWVRPSIPEKWIDENGKAHNYFPDFYLPAYDIFLDPKNAEVCRRQQNKLRVIIKQMSNLKIIETLEECKNFCP